jgi:dUTP pyrophosphatase
MKEMSALKISNEEIQVKIYPTHAPSPNAELLVQGLPDSLGTVPERATPGSAGYDLCSAEEVIIQRESSELIGTGMIIAIPEGWVGKIHERSSLAVAGFVVEAGIIDSDYRGEVKILMRNMTGQKKVIAIGDRIAQLVITPHLTGLVVTTDDLGETERGSGGFGSTDKKPAHVDVQSYMDAK